MCIVMDCAHYACIELFVHMCRWHGCIQHVGDAAELIKSSASTFSTSRFLNKSQTLYDELPSL